MVRTFRNAIRFDKLLLDHLENANFPMFFLLQAASLPDLAQKRLVKNEKYVCHVPIMCK